MSKAGFFLTAMFLSVFLSGCVVDSPSVHRHRPEWSNDQTVIAEIEAASRLMFDDARARALTEIASRRQLSARAQVHLVRTAMDSLMFDNAKQQVLLVLIDNAWFVCEGKKAVLEHVEEFMFDSARQSVLNALSRRGTLPSAEDLRAMMDSRDPLPQTPAIETEITVDFSASYSSDL